MSRVDALGRLGGPTVECGCCFAKVIETQALYLRRLWIDRESGSRTHGIRLLYCACSLTCAEKLEADALARLHSDPDLDSALWIDSINAPHAHVRPTEPTPGVVQSEEASRGARKRPPHV